MHYYLVLLSNLGQYYIDQHHGHLRIDDPMKNLDEGVYTCRVVNSAGSVYHDINLTIISKLPQLYISLYYIINWALLN